MVKKYLNYFIYRVNKKLSIGYIPQAGRNYTGAICVHHQGGGNKKKYIYIDFFRRINSYGIIYKIIKSSFRTGFIGGIIYENGLFSYILLTESLKKGSRIYSGTYLSKNEVGTTMSLKKIQLFTLINNIEIYPYAGGKLVRAAGASGMITAREKK